MDNCVVCCKSNDDEFSRITTVSNEWKDWNIQHIIEKHLWWWYLRPPSNDILEQWICHKCWLEISTFHKFYIQVENMNNKYYTHFNSTIKSEVEELTVSMNVKWEEKNVESYTENRMKLEKIKKERKKQITNPIEAKIIELPAIDIKCENEDISEFTITELDENSTLEADLDTSHDYENSFLNYQDNSEEDKTFEIKDLEDKCLKKKIARKRQAKSKSVSNGRKKYIKNKEGKKTIVIKDRKTAEVVKKRDEFIADNQFDLSCNICKISVDNFSDLKNHFRKQHNILGYAMCCNKKFYKRGVLVDHINVHNDPNYFQCLKCQKALSTRWGYEKHMETHQLYETRETVFTCNICNKSFLKKVVLERHLLIHVPEDERSFRCDLCDKKFASEYLRKQHHNSTHLKKYAKVCGICGKFLYDKISFEQHLAQHNGEQPAKIKCKICDEEFSKRYLQEHIKKVHTKDKQQEQVCRFCSKVSPNWNVHLKHIKYIHNMER
ncbi:transcription factor grauzone-like [Cochliomyia hominivorax]